MIALFCMVCASWTHIGYACQMTRATSINDNLLNKRGIFDDLMEMVSTAETAAMEKSDTADIIVGQKSGPALAGPATTALICLTKEKKVFSHLPTSDQNA